ncbi:MAG: outer membrane lipoprotein carrier protein LolA [Deltaproteobacteria bacterium]|nr:outer membrane lipoprotein carrier protein LolA [Deltaproteobacteria bacterium]MBW2130689.1 outer membrane lipoprotein carrier protein LolA [Deltaproteobacteria bacterium]
MRKPILMISWLLLSLFFLFQGGPITSGAETDPNLLKVLRKVKEREKSIRTFSAAFHQLKKTSLLEDPLRSEGRIFFDRSGKILLKITKPSVSTVLIKKGWITLYYPEFSKKEERYIGERFIRKHFGLECSLEEIEKHYDIEFSEERYSGPYRLLLKPRDKAFRKYVSSIELLLDPGSWLPTSITVMEKGGDVTRITLKFLSINEPLPKGVFRPDIPDTR